MHHSDVVGIKGEWELGEPFSGDLTTDKHGREVLEGSGILSREFLANLGPTDAPYLAVAQKYSVPLQPRTTSVT